MCWYLSEKVLVKERSKRQKRPYFGTCGDVDAASSPVLGTVEGDPKGSPFFLVGDAKYAFFQGISLISSSKRLPESCPPQPLPKLPS